MTGAVDTARAAVAALTWDDPAAMRRAAHLLIEASVLLAGQQATASRASNLAEAARWPRAPLPPLGAVQAAAEWFLAAREALGATRADLADAAGVSVGTVAKLERAGGPVGPRVVVLTVEGLALLAAEPEAPWLDAVICRLDAAALLAAPTPDDVAWCERRRSRRVPPDLIRRRIAAREAQ